MHISEALTKPCVIDKSLLSNFLYSGNALLLRQLINSSLYITPVVLDPGRFHVVAAQVAYVCS